LPETFAAEHVALRNSWVALNRKQATGLWEIFDDSLREIRGEITKNYEPGVSWLRSGRRAALERSLNVEAARFADVYREFIDDSMQKAAKVPLGTQAAARRYYGGLCRQAGKEQLADQLAAVNSLSFAQIPVGTIEALWNRTINGLNLSDRIWDLTEAGISDIRQVLVKGAIGGKDVRWMAKRVEGFIRPESKGPAWTSKGKPAKRMLPDGTYVGQKGQPGMYYAAARLVRTEMRLAAHDAHIRGHIATRELMEPVGLNYLEGVDWKLSGSHPRSDICDDYVAANPYQPGDVPTSHPLCLCHLADRLVSPEKFKDMLDAKPGDIAPKVNAQQAMGKAMATKKTPGMKSLAAAEATDRRAMRKTKAKSKGA